MDTTRVKGKLFSKESNPMSLLPILESRLPLSVCMVNQLLAYDKFKDNFDAYTFEESAEEEINGRNELNNEIKQGDSNIWVLFNYRRKDWNCCITISSPTPTADDISPNVKYALEQSNILNWEEPFVFLNVDLNISDYLIKLNTRKIGNVIKIFPCYLYYMDPEEAAKVEVPLPPDSSITVAPLDPIKGAAFLAKNWDYKGEDSEQFFLDSIPKHVSAGVYLPNGEIVCAAFTAAYGNVCCLVTHKDWRRKGYASLVIRYIFRELGKRGFHACLETALTNHAGMALYKSINPKIVAKVDYICHKAL